MTIPYHELCGHLTPQQRDILAILAVAYPNRLVPDEIGAQLPLTYASDFRNLVKVQISHIRGRVGGYPIICAGYLRGKPPRYGLTPAGMHLVAEMLA